MTAGGGFDQGTVDTIFTLLTYAVAGRYQWRGQQEAGQGVCARVVGILANSQGQVYGCQINQRHVNVTYHAETNLIQAIGTIPQGATLYSTLEPCYQCAGLFVRAGGMRCVYGQNDPNMVNNTALAAHSTRLQYATFNDYPSNDQVTVGNRLDQIRTSASVFAQAAAVGQRFQNTPGQDRVQTAMGQVNLHAIQTRVLNILNTPPSLDLFAQSEAVLWELITTTRNQRQLGDQQRTFVENVAQVLQSY